MKKKIFFGFGIFLLTSMVIGLGSASYYYNVNSPQMYYNVEPSRNVPPFTQTSQPLSTPFSQPGHQFFGPLDVRHKYIVPRVELLKPGPTSLVEEKRHAEMNYSLENGRIREERIGFETRYSVDEASFGYDELVQWKWHYNSHAVHCNETQEGDLICKEVSAHIPREVWAEFFVPQTHELTFASNVIQPKESPRFEAPSRLEVCTGNCPRYENPRNEIPTIVQNINVERVEENFFIAIEGDCLEYDPYDNRCDL